MYRLWAIWLTVRRSLWFLPTVMVLVAVFAAVGLVELQAIVGSDLSRQWPRLLGAGAEGARGMLAAIATSMITVAGVVFSITIVALSLAGSQYSPRVLRNFMSDRPTQVVLGAFVAVFVYCLVVLRTIRGPEEGAFVPSLAVLGGVMMAFAGVGLLIYFIHHVASVIQVTSIIARISAEAEGTMKRQFPESVDEGLEPAASPVGRAAWPENSASIAAPTTGYVVAVSVDGLCKVAVEHLFVVRLLPMVGDFVIAQRPLMQVVADGPVDERSVHALLANVTLGSSRDAHQDLRYSIEQLVDIALRTLSPGIHDPATASACVDHLGALLVHLSTRRFPSAARHHEGHLRVVAEEPGFEEFVRLAFAAIAHHAGTHAPVHARLIAAIDAVGEATGDQQRRHALVQQLDQLLHRIVDADLPPADRLRLQRAAEASRIRLMQAPATPCAIDADATSPGGQSMPI